MLGINHFMSPGILTKSNITTMHYASQFPPHFYHLSSCVFLFFLWLFSLSPLPLHLLYSTISALENLQLSPGLFCSPLISKCVSLVMALFITSFPCNPTTPQPHLFTLFKFPAFSSSSPLFQSFETFFLSPSFCFSFYTKYFLDPKLSFLILLALKGIPLLLDFLCKDTKLDTYFRSLIFMYRS